MRSDRVMKQRAEACKRYRYSKKGKANYYSLEAMRKRRARWALNNAVRDGRIEREPCKCGNPETEGHHHDYDKPFDVEWMCNKCHNEQHRSEK